MPAGVVTEEMLSAHDWYKTFASFAGASDRVPTDRPMDGIDASKFLLGESDTRPGDAALFWPRRSLMSRNGARSRCCATRGLAKPIVEPQFPIFFDLGSDPGENYNLFNDKMDIGWEAGVVLPVVSGYEKSFAQYPNIKPGQEFTATQPKPPQQTSEERLQASPAQRSQIQPSSPRPPPYHPGMDLTLRIRRPEETGLPR